MQLVEQHMIKRNDAAAFASKNLYNLVNYLITFCVRHPQTDFPMG
jgi:hypothetical protein